MRRRHTQWQMQQHIADAQRDLQQQQAADQTQLEWLKLRLQAQAERPSYKTGEVVAPGAFVCLKCGEEIHLHKAGHLPPCPKCAATGYRRTDSR